jgi:long-chain acyl-CoA synthetase
MHPRTHAATNPRKRALIMAGSGEALSYQELENRANQVAHLLRAHCIKQGDCIALLLENSPAFFELVWGAQRAGVYYVCLSTKLTTSEVSYILQDSGAKFFAVSAAFASTALELVHDAATPEARFVAYGALPGFQSYEAARDGFSVIPIADEAAGREMLYSSGTTGRPKGVRVPLPEGPIDGPDPMSDRTGALFGLSGDSIYLSPAPLYHAAPLRWTMAMHRMGATTVIMERFEAQAYLEAVQSHGVTATQVVPTMFVRMLKLPPEVRAQYDVSSLKVVVHAAAPCPVPVKLEMMDWWGPIIHEYYAGTEGNGFCYCSPTDWLARPGSVGRALVGSLRICDEDGALVANGVSGIVYFAGGPAFAYHNDAKRTSEAQHPTEPGWTTLGDIGYVDDDGFLFLTDRKSFTIISGGVNVYPQEVENLLITHPKVADAAVFGVPNDDFGEEVKAVVQALRVEDAGPALAAELMAFCRAHLSSVKCPRSVDFIEELPRHPTGKLYKRLLRDQYWTGRDNKLV